MDNIYRPTNDEEQPASTPTDYRALLAITRPLVVAERSLLSWRGGETCGPGFGTSSGPDDGRPECILRRGEIFRSHESGQEIAQDEEPAPPPGETGMSFDADVEAATAEPTSGLHRRDSSLQIRICLGMS